MLQDQTQLSAAESWLCSVIHGGTIAWPADASEEFEVRVRTLADEHGVLPLLFYRLNGHAPAAANWPATLVDTCRDVAIAQAMWELRHRDLLTRVLAALAEASVQPVLFKGTALAYSLYPPAAQRTRSDTDLIIPTDSLARVDSILTQLGFERAMAGGGEYVSYQASYTRLEPGGGSHALDVHWKINNSELLSHLFSHQELLARSEALPGLGPHARGAGRIDALLLACMHRGTHKQHPYYVDGQAIYEANRLVWLYDIHLLVESLDQAALARFAAMAAQKGLRAVCLDGISAARLRFLTQVDPALLAELSAGVDEPAWRYLEGGRLRQKLMDMQALGNWRKRGRYILELVFPSADYMRWKYPDSSSPLAWLYLRRAFAGVVRQLFRQASR